MGGGKDIVGLLSGWFESGDEVALRRAYAILSHSLYASDEAAAALGSAVVDDIRQGMLAKLLDRANGMLRGAQAPVAYARRAFRNALFSELRKWGPRAASEEKVADYLQSLAQVDSLRNAEVAIDAARAVQIAENLPSIGRLAVLLLTRPDRISDNDWADVISKLPPPPPAKPRTALEREEASMLLYPPTSIPESPAERYQRLNSFDKCCLSLSAA